MAAGSMLLVVSVLIQLIGIRMFVKSLRTENVVKAQIVSSEADSTK